MECVTMIGQTISHYRILEKLGGGGMGVVYKAEDTKLKRVVALKFLPPEFTSDRDAKERFIHEAQAASSLDHPNICTVYEIAESEDGQIFIAMACYEGESLKEKIARGTLKPDEAIGIALQIAEGLAEAHQHGIIHRDIKPANVLITKSGLAKIVDFGLAKVSGATRLTKSGSTLGTIAYMAPEQLQGVEVDARADVFSLGVVLYEMLSGKIPFRGEHEAALMYSILNEEPQNLRSVIPEISTELIQIVMRMLAKGPIDRYQTMNDLLVDLRPLRKAGTENHTPVRRRIIIDNLLTRNTTIGVIIFVVLLATGIDYFLQRNKGPVALGQITTRVLRIPSHRLMDPNISPDGNWIVYIDEEENGRQNLFIVHASGGEPKRVTNDTTRGTMFMPCFSPDASKILYVYRPPMQSLPDLYIVPVLGGSARCLVHDAWSPHWSPDGKSISFFRTQGYEDELWVASEDGTKERKVANIGILMQTASAWSPDSKQLAYIKPLGSDPQSKYKEIFIHDLGSDHEKQLTFDGKRIEDLCWASTGELIYSSNKGGSINLWIIPEVGGKSMQLTVGAGSDRVPRISNEAHRLVYMNESQSQNLWYADLEKKQVQQLTFEEGNAWSASYSRDGSRIAYVRDDPTENQRTSIVLSGKDGSDQMKLIPIEHYVFGTTTWASDDKHILFNTAEFDTLRKNPDSVDARNVFMEYDCENKEAKKKGDGVLLDASCDGNYFVVAQFVDGGKAKIALISTRPPQNMIKHIATDLPGNPNLLVAGVTFSWDSKNVFTSDSTGIWSVPVGVGTAKRVYTWPTKWNKQEFAIIHQMPDGKSILGTVRDQATRKTRLVTWPIEKDEMAEIVDLPQQDFYTPWPFFSSLSPDGKSFVYIGRETKNKIVLLENFR